MNIQVRSRFSRFVSVLGLRVPKPQCREAKFPKSPRVFVFTGSGPQLFRVSFLSFLFYLARKRRARCCSRSPKKELVLLEPYALNPEPPQGLGFRVRTNSLRGLGLWASGGRLRRALRLQISSQLCLGLNSLSLTPNPKPCEPYKPVEPYKPYYKPCKRIVSRNMFQRHGAHPRMTGHCVRQSYQVGY